MTKITEKKLIDSLKQLKDIKPRKDWAVFLKSQILEDISIQAEKQVEIKTIKQPSKLTEIINILSFVFIQKKLAYSLAIVFLFIVGVFGFAQYTVPGELLFQTNKIPDQSKASLTGQTLIKQDITRLNSKINNLSKIANTGKIENIPSAISEININIKELSDNFKKDTIKDPETIKEIALSLKTLSSIPGSDLSENQDVKDLYQILVENQINDFKKTTLTDDQKEALLDIEELYNQEKYIDALEKILLIDK